jgi:hypothetical protein
MKLRLITQNLLGLNDPVALKRTRNYYLPLLGKHDIWYVQEHNL